MLTMRHATSWIEIEREKEREEEEEGTKNTARKREERSVGGWNRGESRYLEGGEDREDTVLFT